MRMRVVGEYAVNNKAVQISNFLHALLAMILIGSVVKVGSIFLSDIPTYQRILFFSYGVWIALGFATYD